MNKLFDILLNIGSCNYLRKFKIRFIFILIIFMPYIIGALIVYIFSISDFLSKAEIVGGLNEIFIIWLLGFFSVLGLYAINVFALLMYLVVGYLFGDVR